MEYESIEQEVKAENLRKHEREETAAIRAHDLAMAKVNRKILHVPLGVMAALIGASIMFASLISHISTLHSTTTEYRSKLKYQKLQSHAAGVQAGLSQGRNECKEGEGR